MIFVYAILMASCVGALFRPHYGIYGYVAFVSLCPQWLWRFTLPDPDFAFQKYVAGATLAGYLFSEFKGQKLVGQTRLAMQCGLIFLILCFASSLQTIAPEPTAIFLDTIWKIMLMLYLTVRLINTPERAITVVWIALACVGWNAWEINIDYLSHGYSRVNLPGEEWALMNANAYSLVLLLAMVLSATLAVTSKKTLPFLVASTVSVLCLHAIYILEARGAMIGLILSAGIFIYLLPKNTTVLVRLGVAVVIAFVLAGPSVVSEFSSSFAGQEMRDVSAESRFYLWDAGIRICADYPLLGVGPWAGEWLVPSYYEFDRNAMILPNKALHNLTLEIATGSGVPAMIAYVAMFFLPLITFRNVTWRSIPPVLQTIAIGCMAAIPGYWLASQFNSGGLIEVPYIVLALALAVGNQCERIKSDSAQNEKRPGISESTCEVPDDS